MLIPQTRGSLEYFDQERDSFVFQSSWVLCPCLFGVPTNANNQYNSLARFGIQLSARGYDGLRTIENALKYDSGSLNISRDLKGHDINVDQVNLGQVRDWLSWCSSSQDHEYAEPAFPSLPRRVIDRQPPTARTSAVKMVALYEYTTIMTAKVSLSRQRHAYQR